MVNFTWEKTGGIGVSNSTTGNNFAVSGNRPQQNLFLLNGVEFTGAAENNMQPGGTSQQLLGVDAVREFNLLRDSYGAEYGKRPGGAGSDRHAIGHQPVARLAVRIPAEQRVGRAQFLRSGARCPDFSAISLAASLGGPIKKEQDLRVRQLRRASASICIRPASIWCRTTMRAPAPCPASW